MLLSSQDFKASEVRLRRVQELSDLSVRKELVESKEQLRAAVEAGRPPAGCGTDPARRCAGGRGRVRALMTTTVPRAGPTDVPEHEPEHAVRANAKLILPVDGPIAVDVTQWGGLQGARGAPGVENERR